MFSVSSDAESELKDVFIMLGTASGERTGVVLLAAKSAIFRVTANVLDLENKHHRKPVLIKHY